MSKTSFYIYAYRCIRAINECEVLVYKFPTSPQEVEDAAQSFKAISSNGVIEGCVAAMDGILMKIMTPSRKEVVNVKAFSSGHYQHCALNAQVNKI